MSAEKFPPPKVIRAHAHGARSGHTAIGPLHAHELVAAAERLRREQSALVASRSPLAGLAAMLDPDTVARLIGEVMRRGHGQAAEHERVSTPARPLRHGDTASEQTTASEPPAVAPTRPEPTCASLSPVEAPPATGDLEAAAQAPAPGPCVAHSPPRPAPIAPRLAEAVSGGRAPGHAAASAARPTPSPRPGDRGPARAPDTSLFRYEALRAYKLGLKLTAPLRVVPLNTGIVVGTLAAVLLAVLVIMSLGKVDLTARGRGVIRASEGVQPLLFEVEGIVREVLVRDGDVVSAGQVLARLDSTRLTAALQEAEEQLRTIDERNREDQAHAQTAYERDSALVTKRAQLTRERIISQAASVGAHTRERGRYASLADDGLVAERQRRDAEEVLHQERRNLLTLQGEQAQLEQQLTELEQSHRTATSLRAQQAREARNRRDVSKLLLTQTELRASRSGRVESLLVNEGDVVGAGRVVARLVSLATGRQITAFLPERERAFVRPGASVRVEFDQLPVGEFGSATGTVVRASSEVAGAQEIERALGAAAPEGVHFAVTLELSDDAATRGLYERVSSGSLLTVRMPVRQRRVIGLVFDPVRKWLD